MAPGSPTIIALFGADQLAVSRRLSALRDEADGGTGMAATNYTRIDGREARAAEIVEAAMALPFLSAKRLVIVDGLLDRFERRPADRRPRSIEPMAPLLEACKAGLPPTTILVLTGGAEVRATNALVAALRKTGAEVEEHQAPKRDALLRFIRDEASARGLRFAPGAADALGRLAGSDTFTISNELDKLALYTMGRTASTADVEAVCSPDLEARTYDFTDGVLEGDLPKARRALSILLGRDNETAEGLIALLLAAYRTLAPVVEMVEQGKSVEEVGKALGLPDWQRDRALRRARRLGRDGLVAAYEVLVDAERAKKARSVDADVALEIAISRLCGTGRRTRPVAVGARG